ncbi:hypothetical protein ABZP36_022948 [Zizania latifolia]
MRNDGPSKYLSYGSIAAAAAAVVHCGLGPPHDRWAPTRGAWTPSTSPTCSATTTPTPAHSCDPYTLYCQSPLRFT